MSKPDILKLHRLEFYKKQKNWKFAREVHKVDEQTESSDTGALNKTYDLDEPSCSQLNDAFLVTEDTPPSDDIIGNQACTSTSQFNQRQWLSLSQRHLPYQHLPQTQSRALSPHNLTIEHFPPLNVLPEPSNSSQYPFPQLSSRNLAIQKLQSFSTQTGIQQNDKLLTQQHFRQLPSRNLAIQELPPYNKQSSQPFHLPSQQSDTLLYHTNKLLSNIHKYQPPDLDRILWPKMDVSDYEDLETCWPGQSQVWTGADQHYVYNNEAWQQCYEAEPALCPDFVGEEALLQEADPWLKGPEPASQLCPDFVEEQALLQKPNIWHKEAEPDLYPDFVEEEALLLEADLWLKESLETNLQPLKSETEVRNPTPDPPLHDKIESQWDQCRLNSMSWTSLSSAAFEAGVRKAHHSSEVELASSSTNDKWHLSDEAMAGLMKRHASALRDLLDRAKPLKRSMSVCSEMEYPTRDPGPSAQMEQPKFQMLGENSWPCNLGIEVSRGRGRRLAESRVPGQMPY